LKLTIVEKIIEKNVKCPIYHETIQFGDAFMTCETCKHNFVKDTLLKYLNEFKNDKCPMCRANWTSVVEFIRV
jgi:hypothetical protein